MSNPVRRPAPSPLVPPSEAGFTLLAVMFLLFLLLLALAVAAPKMAKEIQRDREVETMHRGKQYIRAVQLYYRKFHAYPPTVDALVKTNDIRFLRKKYIDPITGKDDWKPILFGQNKAPTVMGFFGQPLATGGSIAGIGPNGGNGVNGAQNPGGLFNSGSNASSGTLGSIFNSQQSTTTTAGSAGQGANGTDTSNGDSGTSGATGTGGTDSNGNPIPGTGTGLSGQTSGQTFGGGGIIGFSPGSPKPSILTYKKKQRYSEWEFVYDPIIETLYAQGGNTGMIGQPAASGTTPIGNGGFGNTGLGNSGSGNSIFGNGNGTNSGSGGFGNSGAGDSGSGSNPSPPVAPQPQ